MDFHSLRVTYVSLVLESGATAKEAQVLARHSTLALTLDTYGRARPERLHGVAAVVGEKVLQDAESTTRAQCVAAGAEALVVGGTENERYETEGMVPPLGFEPRTHGLRISPPPSETPSSASASDNADSVFATCFAKLRQEQPDLATVLETWEKLPDAVKKGILAAVRTTPGSEANPA